MATPYGYSSRDLVRTPTILQSKVVIEKGMSNLKEVNFFRPNCSFVFSNIILPASSDIMALSFNSISLSANKYASSEINNALFEIMVSEQTVFLEPFAKMAILNPYYLTTRINIDSQPEVDLKLIFMEPLMIEEKFEINLTIIADSYSLLQ